MYRYATGEGEAIGHYLHGIIAPGMGRQAALVKVQTPGGGDAAAAGAAASKVAMHAVAVMVGLYKLNPLAWEAPGFNP